MCYALNGFLRPDTLHIVDVVNTILLICTENFQIGQAASLAPCQLIVFLTIIPVERVAAQNLTAEFSSAPVIGLSFIADLNAVIRGQKILPLCIIIRINGLRNIVLNGFPKISGSVVKIVVVRLQRPCAVVAVLVGQLPLNVVGICDLRACRKVGDRADRAVGVVAVAAACEQRPVLVLPLR